MRDSFQPCEVTFKRAGDEDDRIVVEWKFDEQVFPAVTTNLTVSGLVDNPHLEALRERTDESDGDMAAADARRVLVGTLVHFTLLPTRELREEFYRRLAQCPEQTWLVLRIRISPDVVKLEHVPWELACFPQRDQPERPQWLALRPRLIITRIGDQTAATIDASDAAELAVFYVDASAVVPNGASQLQSEVWPDELGLKQRINKSTELGAAQDVTWENVAEYVQNQSHHTIFHFTGHGRAGDPDGESGQHDAGIFLADRDSGEPVATTGGNAGAVLRDTKVRLAVIAACYAGIDVGWRGFGPTLLRSIPAVVTMQAPVEDDGASIFSRVLYTKLAEGSSLGAAVTTARSAFAEESASVGWWTPVLHTRSPDMSFKPVEGPRPTKVEPSFSLFADKPAWPWGAGGDLVGRPGPDWAPVPVLSPDGGVWARIDCGRLRVGTVDRGRVKQEFDVEFDDAARVVSVSPKRKAAVQVLITDLDEPCTVERSYGLGRRSGQHIQIRCHEERAVCGAWTAGGFVWVDADGAAHGDQATVSLLDTGTVSQVAHAVVGRTSLLAWIIEARLMVHRSGPGEGETRIVDLGERANDVEELLVAPSSTRSAPDAVFVRSDSRWQGWLWSSLPVAAA